MKRYWCVFFIAAQLIAACGNNGTNAGTSTPIDSSNVYGEAPAQYNGNNPARDSITNRSDTGTKADNVHNAGTYDKK